VIDFYIALMAPRFLRSQDLEDLEEVLLDD
jgi:hypothetical protein